MDAERIPAERILFGVMLALALWMALKTFLYQPGSSSEIRSLTPQIALERDIAMPFSSHHLHAAAGPFVDPFGPALVGRGRPENLRNIYAFIRTEPLPGGGGDGSNKDREITPPPPQPGTVIHIPVKATESPSEPIKTGTPQGEEEPPPPEFPGQFLSVGYADGRWHAVVRANDWEPLDGKLLAPGDPWRHNGATYTIISVDWDGVRVQFEDGRERTIGLGTGTEDAASGAAPRAPAGNGVPAGPRTGRPANNAPFAPVGRGASSAGRTGGGNTQGGGRGPAGARGGGGRGNPRGQGGPGGGR